MAEIITKFDTKTKKFTCSMDGQELPNIKSARFYKKWDYQNDKESDDFECGLVSADSSEDEGYKTMQEVYASLKNDNVILEKDKVKKPLFNRDLAQSAITKLLSGPKRR